MDKVYRSLHVEDSTAGGGQGGTDSQIPSFCHSNSQIPSFFSPNSQFPAFFLISIYIPKFPTFSSFIPTSWFIILNQVIKISRLHSFLFISNRFISNWLWIFEITSDRRGRLKFWPLALNSDTPQSPYCVLIIMFVMKKDNIFFVKRPKFCALFIAKFYYLMMNKVQNLAMKAVQKLDHFVMKKVQNFHL